MRTKCLHSFPCNWYEYIVPLGFLNDANFFYSLALMSYKHVYERGGESEGERRAERK